MLLAALALSACGGGADPDPESGGSGDPSIPADTEVLDFGEVVEDQGGTLPAD